MIKMNIKVRAFLEVLSFVLLSTFAFGVLSVVSPNFILLALLVTTFIVLLNLLYKIRLQGLQEEENR